MTRKRKGEPSLQDATPAKKRATSKAGKHTPETSGQDAKPAKGIAVNKAGKRKEATISDDAKPAKKARTSKTGKRKAETSSHGAKPAKKPATSKKEMTKTTQIKKKEPQLLVKQKSNVEIKGSGNKPASDVKLILKDLLKDEAWKTVLSQEFEKEYFKTLEETLQKEYNAGKNIFPPKELIFNALHLTPVDKVKVVILGQDPYHDNGQAMGMSFSVPKDVAIPPSLKNIYNELERDPDIKGFKIPDHGCLEKWAKEGILMINATLTVEAHKPNSHAKFGWQKFTDSLIQAVSDRCDHVVFILWGGFAHKKEQLIDLKKHAAIKTAHPSPLSLNKFRNCNCFSDCDKALTKFGLKPINWSLD